MRTTRSERGERIQQKISPIHDAVNKTHRTTSLALTQGLCTLVMHKVLTNLVTNLLAYCHLEITT